VFFLNKNEEERGSWLVYSEKVRKLTEKTFRREWIEHSDLRGKGWSLDHKLSIRQCYDEGIPPDMASHLCNLEMVPSKYNSSKGSRSSITFTDLIEMVTEYEDDF
jgi:hypothetical protein